MIEQLKTIRRGLEAATCYTMMGVDAHFVQTALTALDQIEAAVGSVEPVADINVRPSESGGTIASVFSHKLPIGSWLLYRHPPAQQPQYEAGDMASASAQGFRDGVASVAQQPSKAQLETLRAWETSGELIDRAWSVLQSQEQEIMRLEKTLAEERAQQPQAEAPQNWRTLLLNSEDNFVHQFGVNVSAAWVYRDLEELFTDAAQQPQAEVVSADLRDRLVAISAAIADQDDRAAQAMIREILAAPQQAEAVPLDVVRDAARYRWLRDASVPPHNFYISVPDEFHGVKYQPGEVDAYIDAAIAAQGEKP